MSVYKHRVHSISQRKPYPPEHGWKKPLGRQHHDWTLVSQPQIWGSLSYTVCQHPGSASGYQKLCTYLQLWALSFSNQQSDTRIILLSGTADWSWCLMDVPPQLSYIYRFIIKCLNFCLDNWTTIDSIRQKKIKFFLSYIWHIYMYVDTHIVAIWHVVEWIQKHCNIWWGIVILV